VLGHKRSQEAELQVTRCMMLAAIGVAAGALLTYFIVNVIKDEGHFHKIQDGQQIHNAVLCFHHTKLYSFRFNCKIVSFTAANTNRMFSVSVAHVKWE